MKTLLYICTLFIGISIAQAETRTWTNSAGTKIEGEFRGLKNGKAQLLVKGKLFEVPLDQLSEEDQKFITDTESGEAKEAKATGSCFQFTDPGKP